jgi:hypothetical protein
MEERDHVVKSAVGELVKELGSHVSKYLALSQSHLCTWLTSSRGLIYSPAQERGGVYNSFITLDGMRRDDAECSGDIQ